MSGERFRGLQNFSHARAQKTPVTDEASGQIKSGLECLFVLLRHRAMPVDLQLDDFLGKDIEIAVRGNGLDIDFMQLGFPGGVPEDFKGSSDIAGQHPS